MKLIQILPFCLVGKGEEKYQLFVMLQKCDHAVFGTLLFSQECFLFPIAKRDALYIRF